MPSKATKRLNKKEINNIIKEAEKKVEENIDTMNAFHHSMTLFRKESRN